VQSAARRDRRRCVARLSRPAILRLQQIHVSAARGIERMPALAHPPAIVPYQRQSAITNRAHEHALFLQFDKQAPVIFLIYSNSLPRWCEESTEGAEMHQLFPVHMPSLPQIGIFVTGILFGCLVNQLFADHRLHKMTQIHWKLWQKEERNRQRLEEEIVSLRQALWSQALTDVDEHPAARATTAGS
jgi:hypothetical protein